MVTLMFNRPKFPDIPDQFLENAIKAVVIEETALANILAFEDDIIQKAKKDAVNLDEFVTINESAKDIIRNITKIQIMTKVKLQYVKELIQKLKNPAINEALEE